MQDIHLQTGGGNPAASRLFAAAEAALAGDRHLHPLHHHHHHHHPSNHALKCPRCDSLNTKFCYYNNYNLSQPRHFCKSCRRYWTKGGVLRNVPVGGGCRKSRHSSSSSSKPPPPPSPSVAQPKPRDESAATAAANNHHHSSSDSSTLTAAAPAKIPTIFHDYSGSCLEKPSTGAATATLYGDMGISIDHQVGSGGVGDRRDDVSTSMLTEIGNFSSLMGSTAEITPFGYAGLLIQHDHAPQRQPHQQEMVVVDGFGTLDWQGNADENNGVDRGEWLFDMTGAVDHAYWSQQNQWTAADVDVDHHHHQRQQGGGGLFLPSILENV